jgi:hypothetical protein
LIRRISIENPLWGAPRIHGELLKLGFAIAQSILGEAHLRRILQTYAGYYNKIRTHRSLDKDAPAFRPVQRVGTITSNAILGGLHHHYVRV